MEAKPVIRMYQGADAFMTEEARVAHGLIMNDLAKFTNFDSTFTPAYMADFLNDIEAADTVVADSAVSDEQRLKTETLNAVMEQARSVYNDVKYFAGKAFPTSSATRDLFGLNDYEAVRKNPAKMIQFLHEMHNAAVTYQAELLVVGFSKTTTTAILDIREALQQSNTDQKTFRKARPKLTEDRIILLNNCYSKLALLYSAAQLVYKDDYAKRKQFVFLSSSASGADDYEGTVPADTVLEIETLAYDPKTSFTFRNTGTVALEFCLSASDTPEEIVVATEAGATVTKTAAELNANATHLLVRNKDAGTAGSYEVTIV